MTLRCVWPISHDALPKKLRCLLALDSDFSKRATKGSVLVSLLVLHKVVCIKQWPGE